MVRPDEDEPVRIHPLAQLLRREHARHDRDAVGPVLGEDPQREPLAREVALAGHDHHAVSLLAGFLFERRRDLPVHGVAQIGQEEAEGARPPDTEAAGRGIRDVVQLGRGDLDRLAGPDADALVVREGARRRRAGDVRPLGDILQEDPTARQAVAVRGHAPGLRLDLPPRRARRPVTPAHGYLRAPRAGVPEGADPPHLSVATTIARKR